MIDNIDFSENQTLFSEEEPLFNHSQEKSKGKKARPKKLLLIGGIVGIFVLLVAMLTAIGGKRMRPPVAVITPTPIPTPVRTSTQIDDLMSEAIQDIEDADPASNALPFPPIAQDIKISK